MAYLIKAYTFDTEIPSRSGLPFYGAPSISFAGGREENIYLDDPSGTFDYGTSVTQSGQKLLKETVLGGETLPEGTTLSLPSTYLLIIESTETSARYYLFFPVTATHALSSIAEIGDRTTVLVAAAEDSTPEFDPTGNYKFLRGEKLKSLPLNETEIPSSYLSSICFAAGTLIETASGPRHVEDLRAGDLVATRDRGLRPLSWTGRRHVSARVLDIAPNLRPVRIGKGTLGIGMPRQDLTVSPQHRILVDSPIAERITGKPQGLVAAKHLCGIAGIELAEAPDGIDYHHLLFDRHELVLSNGCWTESLFTGSQALQSVSPSARREIRALFPQLFCDASQSPTMARNCLSGKEARELTRRHRKNAKPLLAASKRV